MNDLIVSSSSHYLCTHEFESTHGRNPRNQFHTYVDGSTAGLQSRLRVSTLHDPHNLSPQSPEGPGIGMGPGTGPQISTGNLDPETNGR